MTTESCLKIHLKVNRLGIHFMHFIIGRQNFQTKFEVTSASVLHQNYLKAKFEFVFVFASEKFIETANM